MDGRPLAGCLLDLGLFVLHNANELAHAGRGVYLYIPKMECHEEALWWARVLGAMEDYLGLRRGTIRATVLIEVQPK